MDEDKIPQEELDEKLVNDAFQELLDSYLSSRHRKKVDLVTKAFNFARQATLSKILTTPWRISRTSLVLRLRRLSMV